MKWLGTIAGLIASVCIVMLILPLFLFMIAVVLCLVTIGFVTGVPIHVRKDGEVIGEIVYFKYYPKENSGE